MTVTPIIDPLPGERVLQVDPAIERFPERDMRQRLRPFAGRALTHTALSSEQRWRNGNVSGVGRSRSPGVMRGLEVSTRTLAPDRGDEVAPRSVLYVAPGQVLTAGGAIITVNRPVTAALDDVYVYHHADWPLTRERTAHAPVLPTLSDAVSSISSLPAAAILMLEPVYAEVLAEPEDDDACEIDPSDYAFENWQLIDAARLVLYTWPDDWLALPVRDSQWRNRLAQAIFQKERQLAGDTVHPWQQFGAPLALIGFDAEWRAEFIDRNSVVRTGGVDRSRIAWATPAAGDRYLWDAQFRQFNEELAELASGAEDPLAAALDGFRYLPPVGVLPKSFVTPREQAQDFFPASYQVNARPLPFEQIELAVRQSQSLLPYDVNTPDHVEVIVPVPQSVYEPALLEIERIDAAFDRAIRRYGEVRDGWVGRQLEVRRRAAALRAAIGAPLQRFPRPDLLEIATTRHRAEAMLPMDLDAIDSLELPAPFVTAPIEVGRAWRLFKGTIAPPTGWLETGFDDSGWTAAQSGFGFGAGTYTTELDDMPGGYLALFARARFALEADALSSRLVCSVITNGGIAVFLNGTEVYSSGLTGRAHTVTATPTRGPVVHKFVIDGAVAGSNVLAIQVHLSSYDVQDFLFVPRVVAVASVSAYGAFEIEEEDHGSSLIEPAAEAEPTYIPEYAVTRLETLKTELAGTPLTADDIVELDELGLERFIERLEAKVSGANDRIDFGFVRVQTDIYRIRQFMLGNTEATKLATSPVLATIATGETANVTKEELGKFVEGLRDTSAGGGAPGPDALVAPAPRGLTASRGGFAETTRSSRDTGDTFLSGGGRGGLSVSGGRMRVDERSPLIDEKLGGVDLGAREGKLDETIMRGDLFAGREVKSGDIEEQVPIVGATAQYHNVTVAQRLEEPIATNAKTSSVATKADVLGSFLDSGINVDDIEVPGFRDESGVDRTGLTFADVRDGELIDQILNGQHDRNEADAGGEELGDEAAFFTSSVRAMENAAIVLRKMEGRVQAYRRVITTCTTALGELRGTLAAAEVRLDGINQSLAEARHDLSVARTLRDEEQARVDAVNVRRDQVLAEEVPFLLFRRPRFADVRREVPARTLRPAAAAQALPECEVDEADTPEEISAMMDLLRDAPLKWFAVAKALLGKLNRKNDMSLVMVTAQSRARSPRPAHPRFQAKSEYLDRFDRELSFAYAASQKSVSREREQLSLFNSVQFNQSSWRDMSRTVETLVSLGDVIDGSHGRMEASRIAAQELADIRRVVTCIYLRFNAVPATIKLSWIDKLSQFDSSVDLRNLYRLPRWGEVALEERQDLQKLVDWLYGRTLSSFAEARGLTSDLIRMALLLASHAPIDKLITGSVAEPTQVRPGKEIRIAVDTRRVHVGMQVLVQAWGATVAEAVVDNIDKDQVVAQVLKTHRENVQIEAETVVQIKRREVRGAAPKAQKKRRDRLSLLR